MYKSLTVQHSRLIALLTLSMTVSACALAPTPYQAHQGEGGYYEQQLESNRYRVQFAGNSQTDKATVENYLLYRCAELTLDKGYQYFVTVKSETERESSHTQTISFGTGFGHWHWYPFGTVSVSNQESVQRYLAEAQILMYKGDKPQNQLQAFDAWQIIQSLGPQIVRP